MNSFAHECPVSLQNLVPTFCLVKTAGVVDHTAHFAKWRDKRRVSERFFFRKKKKEFLKMGFLF
jgi:hypothetical protein